MYVIYIVYVELVLIYKLNTKHLTIFLYPLIILLKSPLPIQLPILILILIYNIQYQPSHITLIIK